MSRAFLPVFVIHLLTIPMIAEETVFRMPTGRDTCFKSYSYTNSAYIQFCADGTYRQINREHMFVEESDRGKWCQEESGEITLISKDHYRSVECGPLRVFVWFTRNAEALPKVKAKVAQLLAQSASETFTKTQIERIGRYEYDNCNCHVSVEFPAKTISRKQLQALVKAIDDYLGDPKKNEFHVTPMVYDGVTFLLWKDAKTPINRDLNGITKDIGRLKPGVLPPYIYTKIDKDVFEKESRQTQEFIFFPEMNRSAPQPKQNAKQSSQ
jgi:hypothetical protein